MVVLGSAAFAAARGAAFARRGALLGSVLGIVGLAASDWPRLARAVDLAGGTFVGPFLSAVLPAAVALTAALAAAVLLSEELRPHAGILLLVLSAAWVLPTMVVAASLTRWWGLGPRSLAEAAGVPTGEGARRWVILWLPASRGGPVRRELMLETSGGVDLSPRSLAKIESFLRRVGHRDVFSCGALAALRQGWRRSWRTDRALDALALAVPGRVHPDYRRALDLLKAGPLTAERLARLERLEEESARSSAGFEDAAQSQAIFEGFSAAYARFGDEEKARRWLYRIDNLWPMNEQKIEVTPVEYFRSGRVAGVLRVDGRAASAVRVGLFLVWKSSSAAGDASTRLLSLSTVTDAHGRFAFRELGPGRYVLALMASASLLGGRLLESPGEFELGLENRQVLLSPIRLESGEGAMDESVESIDPRAKTAGAAPGALLRWPRR